MRINFFIFLKKTLFIIFLSSLLLPVTATAEKKLQTSIVNVIGAGRVCNNNISKSRKQAIANSLLSALDIVLSDIIERDSLIRNFEKLNKIFYKHTDQYITDYKVLAELSSGNRYIVMVQATVSTNKVKTKLANEGILLGKSPLPKILFLITEQNIYDSFPKYWWGRETTLLKSTAESIMAESMAGKGFYVINHAVGMPSLDEDAINYPMNLNDMEAVKIGTRLKADIVVIGSAVASKTINTMGSNIRAFKGIIDVRVLRTNTGAEIAATKKDALSVNSDEIKGAKKALANAGQLVAEELSTQIIAALQDKKKTEMLEVLVQGTENLSNFVMFRKALESMPGITNVQIKEMNSGEATIIVLFQGNAKELADALMLKTFVMFGININELSENYLKIKLIKS
ncbi:MAG: hypothetical protein J7K84_02750 [Deltaproteobacteria bacterium]|nr:hypothetical protein [Deltaproteobacteria bacterium]